MMQPIPSPGMMGGGRPGQRLFAHLDGKGGVKNGQISWTEFAPLCQQIGWDQATAQNLWFQTDTDRSGQLSHAEFLTFASRPDVSPYLVALENRICGPVGVGVGVGVAPPGQHANPPGARLFRHLDGKGSVRNGQLSWTEFAPLCQQIGWDQATAQNLWFQTDTDRSGQLSYMEFLQFAARPDVAQYLTAYENRVYPVQPQPGMPMAGGMVAQPGMPMAGGMVVQPGVAMAPGMVMQPAVAVGQPFMEQPVMAQPVMGQPVVTGVHTSVHHKHKGHKMKGHKHKVKGFKAKKMFKAKKVFKVFDD